MNVVQDPDNSAELISEWIKSYEKDLLRLCCVYLKDVTLAEDAVQETFLKAYRHLSAFRGNSSPKTWLVRIAINVCRDMCRTSWFRLLRSTTALGGRDIAQPDGDHMLRSALMAEILHLPRVCREVILLYYYEGFTQAEISGMLRVSVTTVHRRLEKAHRLLQHALKGGMQP